jgi:hypothetical protein
LITLVDKCGRILALEKVWFLDFLIAMPFFCGFERRNTFVIPASEPESFISVMPDFPEAWNDRFRLEGRNGGGFC